MSKVFSIKPYQVNGEWFFDDAERSIVKEDIIGMNEIINVVVAKIPNAAEKGFTLAFSDAEFEGAQLAFDWVEEDEGGNTYEWRGHGMYGWLCAVLLRFYDVAPKALYAKVSPIS